MQRVISIKGVFYIGATDTFYNTPSNERDNHDVRYYLVWRLPHGETLV